MNIMMRRDGMNKALQKRTFRLENLNQEHYFEAVLQKIETDNLLATAEIDNIKLQCIQLLARQTECYTGGASSSVTVEKAQSIMLSVFYCISVYLKTINDADSCINEIKQKSVKELYNKGRALIDDIVKNARGLLDEVRKNRLDTNNIAYNDTVDEGMTSFFSLYNADYAAHDSIILRDYPICNDKLNLAGVECIYNYLNKLHLENEFCMNYSPETIHCLLQGYNENYEELLINIFERILTNALGKILSGKAPAELNIKYEERQYLQHKLEKQSAERLKESLDEASEKLFIELNIANTDLQQYIQSSLRNIAQNIYNALKNNKLEAVFISYKVNTPVQQLKFEDGMKMEDELFRKITAEIRECRFGSDKVSLIRESIHSIIDLVDVFEAECIFDDEYRLIYEALENIELALLLKVIQARQGDDIELEEWQNELIKYMDEIDTDRGSNIRLLCDTIEIS